jgi:hypothetical protein
LSYRQDPCSTYPDEGVSQTIWAKPLATKRGHDGPRDQTTAGDVQSVLLQVHIVGPESDRRLLRYAIRSQKSHYSSRDIAWISRLRVPAGTTSLNLLSNVRDARQTPGHSVPYCAYICAQARSAACPDLPLRRTGTKSRLGSCARVGRCGMAATTMSISIRHGSGALSCLATARCRPG